MKLSRISYFAKLSLLTAERGTCNKLKVGCVLVNRETNRVASIGYNSSYAGTPHCVDVGCLLDDNGHCLRTLHAEVAAVLNLEKNYSTVGLICYTTHQPCNHCYKILVSAGVREIFYIHPYGDDIRNKLINLIQIPTIQLKELEGNYEICNPLQNYR